MIWELGVSCGLVFVGHARTLYRVWRVNNAEDTYESALAISIASYDGPLAEFKDVPGRVADKVDAERARTAEYYKRGTVDRTDPEDIEAWGKAVRAEQHRGDYTHGCRCLSCKREQRKATERWTKEIEATLDRPRAWNTLILPHDVEVTGLNPKDTVLGADKVHPITRRELEEMPLEELVRLGYLPEATFHDTNAAGAILRGELKLPRGAYVDALHDMLTSHQCRACGLTSYNDNDVRHSYCGACHHFCKDSGDCLK